MKHRLLICLSVALFTSGLAACSSNLSHKEYVQWVEKNYENGLHLRQASGAYTFDIQYKPAPYVVLQQENASTHNPELFKSMSADYENMQYYTLTIGLTDSKEDFLDYGISTVTEQQQKLYYFSYLFQNDIYVEEKGRKLPCALFHFERSYDLKPSRTFVLGFENSHNGSVPSELIINSPWLQTGPIRVHIEKTNIPAIKI